MASKILYLVTEPDGIKPVGLWSKKYELAAFLTNYRAMKYRVFAGRDGQNHLQEVIPQHIIDTAR